MTVVCIDAGISFAKSGNKIWIPVTKLLLWAAVGDLTISKKNKYWVVLNAVLLPPLLAETALLDGETENENLLKILEKFIAKKCT